MNRPSTLAEVAQRVSAGAPFGPTLREFLDEFYMNPERRAAMIADEPPALKDPHHNAMLGAVGEHLARRWNLPIAPTWTDHPSRFLHRAIFHDTDSKPQGHVTRPKPDGFPPPPDLYRGRTLAPRPDAASTKSLKRYDNK